MIRIKNENILNMESGILVHQCNCLGIMGGGVAKAVKDKYPKVFREYKVLCDRNIGNTLNLLGETQFVKCEDGIVVANIFGQLNVGMGRQTDYFALESGLKNVLKYAIENDIGCIGIPYKIGCGLGGGNWAYVSKIIDNIFSDVDLVVELYRI